LPPYASSLRVKRILFNEIKERLSEGKIMNEIKYKPIGVIHSPFKEPKGTPIQPAAAKGVNGTVEVFPEYAKGLKDIKDFSHIILIYHFHLSKGSSLIVKPYMDNEVHGVFAMRGPSRPNPIGISVVRLARIEENIPSIKINRVSPSADAINSRKYWKVSAGGSIGTEKNSGLL